MKHIYIFLFLLCSLTSIGQASYFDSMNYQASVRESGELLENTIIQVRFIFYSASTGDISYQESQTVTTNAHGMFSTLIGTGTVEEGSTFAFGSSDEMEVELNTGSGWVSMGSSELGSTARSQVARSLDNTYIYVGDPFLVLTSFPTLTVGGIGTEGGNVLVGNEDSFSNIRVGGSTATNKTLFDVSNDGGNGRLEIKGSQVKIGDNDLDFGLQALDVTTAPGSYGIINRSSNFSHSWEMVAFNNGTFSLYADNSFVGSFDLSTGAYTSISDRSTKQNIQPLSSALDKVMLLQPMSYEFIKNNPTKRKSLGFIAQDVQQVLPELVFEQENREDEGSTLTMDYSGFGIIAVAAIQEQQTEIDELKAIISDLQSQINQLAK